MTDPLRWFNLFATVLLGIVPATLSLVSSALYYWQGFVAIPEGASIAVEWNQPLVLGVLGAAGVVGYIALFYAARGRVGGRVAVALLVGVVAMVAAVWLDLTPYWLGRRRS